MAARPRPVPVVHFTHVGHLATVVRRGLVSDSVARREGLIGVEVGDHAVKARRRRRVVPAAPGGVVADYVPFYYAPRSPMMYVIDRGGVATYTGGCDDLVYLVTTAERLAEFCAGVVFTDRNAAVRTAEFTTDPDRLDDLIDWPLMRATMWNDTPDLPDRKERRMAECLVHERVPWEAFTQIGVKSDACARLARTALAPVGCSVPIVVRRGWYF